MNEKVVKLPNHEQIMESLIAIGEDSYMAERFYPSIAQEANRELVGSGVVLMLTLKIEDFMTQGGYPPVMRGIMFMRMPDYIDALVKDPEVNADAKAFYQECREEMKKK